MTYWQNLQVRFRVGESLEPKSKSSKNGLKSGLEYYKSGKWHMGYRMVT